MSEPLAIVRQFLGERLGVPAERVTESATFAELDVDSMMQLELLFEFEDRLGLRLDRSMAMPKTVGQLIGIVGKASAAISRVE